VKDCRKKALAYMSETVEEAKAQAKRGGVGEMLAPVLNIQCAAGAFRAIGLMTESEEMAYSDCATALLHAPKSSPTVSVEYGWIVLCGPQSFGCHLERFPEKCWVGRDEGADQIIVFLNKEAARKYASNRTEATRPITPLTIYPCFYVESALRLFPWPSWIPEGGAVLADAVLRLEQEIAP
jgi:hypothetical protein